MSPQPTDTASLVMRFDDGIAYADETCRRGEVICWPSWQAEPTAPVDTATAKRLIALMGGAPAQPPRRIARR
jgi:hypothetical protein